MHERTRSAATRDVRASDVRACIICVPLSSPHARLAQWESFFSITLAITAAKYGRAFDNAKKVRLNLVANFNATERAAAVMLL